MNYQNTNKIFGFSFKNISSIASLYFLYSGHINTWLFSLLTNFNDKWNKSINKLVWTIFILDSDNIFAAIFILFLPVEFLIVFNYQTHHLMI
ncbi:hypothetical protein CM15mP35_08050 [bacterium]|nr:MAG: hypothetical protein CM15mP35_08050 [bacterium]